MKCYKNVFEAPLPHPWGTKPEGKKHCILGRRSLLAAELFYEKLFESGAVSAQLLDENRNILATAQVNLRASEAQIRAQQAQISRVQSNLRQSQ
ncbi:hypothetical protein [Candidatus Cyanaurora vandensis]|uniref:hypothetical protein n=1 Tax=Candidatus Cyanaurora vandensis TaxID=2714958 RepID=UPI00257B7787|nr:hypothetical protein [Candidatus Cyanaurora vandensis]